MTVVVLVGSFVFALALVGAAYVGVLVHELVHVIQGEGRASGVCLVSNARIHDDVQSGRLLAVTIFNVSGYDNVESYKSFREWSEGWAELIQVMAVSLLSFGLGAAAMVFPTTRRMRWRDE